MPRSRQRYKWLWILSLIGLYCVGAITALYGYSSAHVAGITKIAISTSRSALIAVHTYDNIQTVQGNIVACGTVTNNMREDIYIHFSGFSLGADDGVWLRSYEEREFYVNVDGQPGNGQLYSGELLARWAKGQASVKLDVLVDVIAPPKPVIAPEPLQEITPTIPLTENAATLNEQTGAEMGTADPNTVTPSNAVPKTPVESSNGS